MEWQYTPSQRMNGSSLSDMKNMDALLSVQNLWLQLLFNSNLHVVSSNNHLSMAFSLANLAHLHMTFDLLAAE